DYSQLNFLKLGVGTVTDPQNSIVFVSSCLMKKKNGTSTRNVTLPDFVRKTDVAAAASVPFSFISTYT
ncbi:hypothetical protein GWI33_012056, partial [Rhynchophorus ferrugineus]